MHGENLFFSYLFLNMLFNLLFFFIFALNNILSNER